MRILNVIRSLDPAGGGPIEVVKQFGATRAFQAEQFEVASLDAPGNPWEKELPFPAHALGPVRGHYAYSPHLVPWLRQHWTDYDVILAHGLWQYGSFAVWRAAQNQGAPYFVFPHGMLDPWFKRTYPLKHLKKWLYWPWAEYRVLRDARAVLFTCEEESRLAKESFWLYRAQEKIVNLGTAEPPGEVEAQREMFLARFPDCRDKKCLLFMGRIHEKKGCDLLIRAFANVSSVPHLHLIMAGPDQTGWQPALEQMAIKLGLKGRLTWTGMLKDDLKWGALRVADAFVLPSHQENFGIAVVEALACGVPVLVSDQVNIWREIKADGAGGVAPDTLAGTTQLLQNWVRAGAEERRQWRQNARASFCRRFEINQAASGLLATLRNCGVKN